MPEPSVRVLGAYRVQPTAELFGNAMAIKYGDLELSPPERADAEEAVRRELGSIALIETEVVHPDSRFDVGDFRQPGSDQAAYDEAYLSENGERVLSRVTRSPGDLIRVAFFLHYFDPGRPLRTSYGEVQVPAPQPMPERLARLIPYEPVD